MFAPRNEVPRRSSPAYGATSQPLGSRCWSAATLPSSAIIVRAAAMPSEYFRSDPILVSFGWSCYATFRIVFLARLLRAVVRDSEFLEQVRRHHSAFRIIADPTVKFRVGESIAKRLHALPYRIVNVCAATTNSLVKLGRDVSRLCLHKICVV